LAQPSSQPFGNKGWSRYAQGVKVSKLNSCSEAGFQPTSQQFGNKGWSLYAQGVKVSKLVDYRQLYTAMWATNSLEYWATKHDIPFTATLLIDWDACRDAI
jgi:hypothetical protein